MKPIRYARPSLGRREAAALKEAFKSGWVGSGVYARLFEQRVGKAVGRPFVAATNSGTAALHLALKVLDLKGAEVLTTPLTVPASNHAILYSGATPVFCDVEEDTGNIDWRGLAARVTRKTKAIMVVHLNGHACDMDPILALAREKGLAVVEDACAALPVEGTYKGRALGSLGDLGCFSFSGLKNLTTLDGGAVAHGRRQWAERLSRLKHSGQRLGEDGPSLAADALQELGFHYRMNDVAAVIGLAQLARWEEFSARLRRIELIYREGLAGLSGLDAPKDKPYARRSLLYFPIRAAQKASLRAFLAERGIETGDFMFPNHLFDLYKPYRRSLPVAEKIAGELLYLPFHPLLTNGEAERVVDAVRKAGSKRAPRSSRKIRGS